jgi:hypothetical protein
MTNPRIYENQVYDEARITSETTYIVEVYMLYVEVKVEGRKVP